MKPSVLTLSLASAALLFVGCSPRLDTGNAEAFETSLDEMSAELEGEEEKEFQRAVAAITLEAVGSGFGSMLMGALSGDEADVESKMEETILQEMEKYDGMTASQIVKEAKQLDSWETAEGLGALGEAFGGLGAQP